LSNASKIVVKRIVLNFVERAVWPLSGQNFLVRGHGGVMPAETIRLKIEVPRIEIAFSDSHPGPGPYVAVAMLHLPEGEAAGLFHLRELHLDRLKIDRSFVTCMLEPPEGTKNRRGDDKPRPFIWFADSG
jgi:hypothetical protein